MVKIYLDAGHGGTDSGATGNGLYEKNITLDIIEKIKKSLEKNYKNVEIKSTRDTDIFISLNERCHNANTWGADVFLAIHINAATATGARGWESFIYNNSPNQKSVALQNTIHPIIVDHIKSFGITDRGKSRANYEVLRDTNMAAILTENLFITNSADAGLLKREDFKQAVADGHVLGLEKFLGLEKTLPPPSPSQPAETNTLYQVIAGTFSQKDNADAMVEKLKKDGYQAYVIVK